MCARRLRLMESLERKFAPLESYHIDIFGMCEDAREDIAYCRKKLEKADRQPAQIQSKTGGPVTEDAKTIPENSSQGPIPMPAATAGDEASQPRTIAGRHQVALERGPSKLPNFFRRTFSRRSKTMESTKPQDHHVPPTTSNAETTARKPRRRLSKVNRKPESRPPVTYEARDAAMTGHSHRGCDDGMKITYVPQQPVGGIEQRDFGARPPSPAGSRSSEITYNYGR